MDNKKIEYTNRYLFVYSFFICYNLDMDKELFLKASELVFSEFKERKMIGILAEKNVHSIIKFYLEPDKEYHEIKVGNFYADIKKDNHIYEIQTRSFDKLRAKLDCFLSNYEVTIVYPIDHKKWILWINKDSGLVEQKNLSKHIGNINHIFKELYKIKTYLVNPRIHLKILLIDLEETRILDGYSKDLKKGSTKLNKYPLDLFNEVDIYNLYDYKLFIPESIPSKFASKDYAKQAKITKSDAQIALNVLNYLDIVNRVGKDGKSYIYQVNECLK